MTTAVAAPAAAPCPRRGAAGRRALQVVLFLGGLLALGLFFGSRAQADQQPDLRPDLRPERQTVQRLLPQPVKEQRPVRTVTEPAAQAAQAAHAVAPEAAAPPAPTPRDVARAVLSPVTGPVRDTVRQVTRPVGAAVESTVGTAVSGLRDITVVLPPEAERPLPVPSLPVTPEQPQTGPAPDAPDDAAPDLPAAPRPGSVTGTGVAPDGTAAAAPHREAAADHRPAPRGPFGPDGGQQGHSASAEIHPPRGGDQHAVPSADGTSFGLVRGAGLPATAAPVRDRSGDILEFPG
ncbi:hypothetical protein [Streptomyces sp. NBC_00385]|uniref:hypothetical protein n=1 Tax=Streptomyces sp. NBC_00385 TaxID=2975733 RepID=UPI002DDB24EC|nr:hypothetical protein [Streptomyces sp. NBC_00385]WRZ04384.1 hypothetical protein OG959_13950 [Streptomyces sp. NBC_00385]